MGSPFQGEEWSLFREVGGKPLEETMFSTLLRNGEIKWIHAVSRVAKTGYVQIALILGSLAWTLWSVLGRHHTASARPMPRITRAPFWFEASSQLARLLAVAFTLAAAIQGKGLWLNAAITCYAFLLGLLRLTRFRMRRFALHQVNVLLAGDFVVLSSAELLPLLDIHSTYRPSRILVGAIASLAAALLTALATPREWSPGALPPEKAGKMPEPQPSLEETCSWLGYFFTYGWLTPLIWKGSRRPLGMDELPSLPWYDDPVLMLAQVLRAREMGVGTLWTVLRFLHKEILLMAIYISISFVSDITRTFAMYHLLNYLADPPAARFHPALWLALLFLGPVTSSVTKQQYIFVSTRLIVRVKSGFTQELYHRAMTCMELEDDVLDDLAKGESKGAQKSTATGRLANLMASDIDAIFQARDIVMTLVGVPIASTLSFIGLYLLMGWCALVGTALIILSSPFAAYMAQMVGGTQRRLKLAQDSRISLVSEYLAQIRAIKYFAWEGAMTGHINAAREKEQKHIWRLNVLEVAIHSAVSTMPIVALVTMFTLFVGVRGERLTAAVAFTTIALVVTLRSNVSAVGYLARSAMSAWISIKRLDRYFSSTTPLTRHAVGPLHMKQATFRRNKNAAFVLHNLSVDFVEGGLNVVTGQSGSGKTTLLLSVLGETVLEKGYVARPEDVAFASQSAWLQNASIKDNILFSSPLEPARYDGVVEACCLQPDLDELLHGDLTEVGENGTSLSGGQRSRVALARALYSKAPLVLLDDVFSALDSKTAAALWERCFCSDMLRGRTVVLVTNVPWIAAQGDTSLELENGRIKVFEKNIGITRTPVSLSGTGADETGGGLLAPNGSNGALGGADAKAAVPVAPKDDDISKEMATSNSSGRMMLTEYMKYYGSPFFVVFCLFTSVMSILTYIGSTLWISIWVGAYDKGQAVNIAFYLGVYAAISFGEVLVDAVQVLVYARGGWAAAKRLHGMFVTAMMNAPLAFYRVTPVGRIVNRMSRDMSSLDNQLSRVLLIFIGQVVQLVLSLAAVSSILPVFMLPALAASLVGVVAGEMYTRTSVVVKKLLASSQSPVFSQFADSLAGMPVIRARAAMPENFADQLADRLRAYSRATEVNYNLNRWVAVRIDFITALVMVSAGLIAVIKAGTIPAALVGFSLTNATNLSGTILILIRTMNQLEIELQSFNRILEYATVEPEEKLTDTPALQSGQVAADGSDSIPPDWPRTGAVEFRNVTVKYDLDGPDILTNINLRFNAGDRVAIVGRTGSGKSTLALSLLGFTHIVSGAIFYDGVDITMIPKRKLREALTIIPQEAVLFNGTVASNLDPSGAADPSTLQHALDACAGIASFQFRPVVPTPASGTDAPAPPSTETQPLLPPPGAPPYTTATTAHAAGLALALATDVAARGENFSHGQRQVLSLCRALVRRSRLLLLDEATAAMDYATDRGVQAVLRRELDDDAAAAAAAAWSRGAGVGGRRGRGARTLVTIAHRLRTIADYDAVVVLGGGRVLETGGPGELMARGGVFADMVRASGEGEELGGLMGRA